MGNPQTCPGARRAAKDRAGGRCEDCGDRLVQGWYHAHHVTYERWGEEKPEDLLILCVPCHAKRHPHMENMVEQGPPHLRKKRKEKRGPRKTPDWKKVRCQECGRRVAPGKGFRMHVAAKHPEKRGELKEPPTLQELEHERRERERRRVVEMRKGKECDICDRVLADEQGREQHMMDKHPQLGYA